MDFAVPVDNREEIKESEKRYEYLDSCQRTKKRNKKKQKKKQWNMRVSKIPIVFGALGTVPNGIKRELDEFEILPVVLRSTKILRGVSET